jgi:ribosomal protein L7/L12
MNAAHANRRRPASPCCSPRGRGAGEQAHMTDQLTEAQLTMAIERIEKRLDWIEENLGRVIGLQYVPMGRSDAWPDAAGVPDDVLALVRAGKKMDAIRRYRELTGLDFAHAQEVIDNL